MKFIFYSPVNFEKWDYDTPDKRGIGGSETSHIEMSWRLARRGHEVISYAPVPWKGTRKWRGVKWISYKKADFSQKGIWVLYRCPDVLEKWSKKKGQILWLVSQDEWYPNWKPKYAKKLDKLIALCTDHKNNILRHHPELKDKVDISSNGIKMDLIREIEKLNIKRNPKKIIYASSPDRGLKNLLNIFPRVLEYVPDMELHIFYGFNNIDKLIKINKQFRGYKEIKETIENLLPQKNVYLRGRINQVNLIKEWFSAGIWCYPTNFTETSCITSMEAQACGVFPITAPVWALRENVKYGIVINGDADNDPLTQSRYVAEIIRAVKTNLADSVRFEMMKESRAVFNWERQVDQWEEWVYKFGNRMYVAQYNFQLKNAKGKILNIGCDIDGARLKDLGAVNVDILKVNPVGVKNKVDIIADARNLPEKLHHKFDTVILGDILEHMNDEDIVKSLTNAKKCLHNGGNVVITCPNDFRPVDKQHTTHVWDKSYAQGISSHHERPISKEHIESLINKADMKINHYQLIDYSYFEGHGILCS